MAEMFAGAALFALGNLSGAGILLWVAYKRNGGE